MHFSACDKRNCDTLAQNMLSYINLHLLSKDDTL